MNRYLALLLLFLSIIYYRSCIMDKDKPMIYDASCGTLSADDCAKVKDWTYEVLLRKETTPTEIQPGAHTYNNDDLKDVIFLTFKEYCARAVWSDEDCRTRVEGFLRTIPPIYTKILTANFQRFVNKPKN